MENIVLFDWLSATLPEDGDWPCGDARDGSSFIQILGMTDVSFQVLNGPHGPNTRLYFDGISIHLPTDKAPFCWLEMSGSGCRAFETYGHGNWKQLLNIFIQFCNITRLDIAFDDHDGILDMSQLVLDTYFNPCFVSKSHYHECHLSFDDRTNEKGTSIYHGRESSNTLIRIYDKAAQLGFDTKTHWVRVEMQLRRENASAFASRYLSCHNLGELFSGVLVDYLRYCEQSDSDSNKWRWPLADYWAALVGSAARIRLLSTPGVEYNIQNLESYVFGQAGNSIRTFIDCFGVDKFLERLKETQPVIVPEKYNEILRKWKK